MPVLVGAGRMPGLHRRLGGLCHVRAGQTGSSCWEVREFGFVCKAGRGGERLRGSRQPPVSPSLEGGVAFSSKRKEGFFLCPVK